MSPAYVKSYNVGCFVHPWACSLSNDAWAQGMLCRKNLQGRLMSPSKQSRTTGQKQMWCFDAPLYEKDLSLQLPHSLMLIRHQALLVPRSMTCNPTHLVCSASSHDAQKAACICEVECRWDRMPCLQRNINSSWLDSTTIGAWNFASYLGLDERLLPELDPSVLQNFARFPTQICQHSTKGITYLIVQGLIMQSWCAFLWLVSRHQPCYGLRMGVGGIGQLDLQTYQEISMADNGQISSAGQVWCLWSLEIDLDTCSPARNPAKDNVPVTLSWRLLWVLSKQIVQFFGLDSILR